MQKSVEAFIREYGLECGEYIRYIDLTSEVGELGKEILKGSDYGKSKYCNTENAEAELGDCLFSLLALCCEMNIDAEAALRSALAKYKRRFSASGNIGSDR